MKALLRPAVAALLAAACAHGVDSAPGASPKETEAEAAVESAHRELWRRLVDEHNVVLDYADLDGRIIRPTPEECRELKPSALSWGVPVEDGPMFNGLYLDALCNRWKITRASEDRNKARRLVDGLLFLASRGGTPGFIARGVATNGRTTYPMGSNDQTGPWLYGMWRYLHDGLAEPGERAPLVAKFVEIVNALDAYLWRMPCDGPPSEFRGSFTHFAWEGAPRLLFVLKAMHELTGDAKWQQRYLDAANERGGNNDRSRLDICRTGVVFDPGQGARNSWTSSPGVACLRAMWEMETDPALRDAYAQGLRASAELCAKSLPLCANIDPNGTEHFEHDWHVMNESWKPQASEAEAVAVANAGLRVQGRASPRLHLEKDWVREPCFAAWVVTLCPDADFVAQHREAILKVLTHYRYDRLYLSQFFPVESAWWRLAAMAVAETPDAAAVEAKKTGAPAGILMDDGAGEFTGNWVESTKQKALVGAGYRHDDNKEQGAKKARFTPEIPAPGAYEVRLIYVATSNRATNATVVVTSAEGTTKLALNQREEALVNGVPRALGVFQFEAGKKGFVELSNEGANGFVVVDAVQFVPAAIAQAEREGEQDAGFGALAKTPASQTHGGRDLAAAVAVSPLGKTTNKLTAPPPPDTEPVQLAKDANPADVDGRSYDLVVIGGTGAGVMCAVRAAREGCSVLLVQHNRHLGGMMANGLMQWDALYGGPRAPLFTELLRNIEKHYVAMFGENSRDHQTVRYTHEHYPIGWAEPHVAEREFNRLAAGEKNLTVLLAHYPTAIERDGALLRSVTLREYGGAKEIRVRAAAFADATYEGDLFALAKVPYRVGREARDEFGEPHAGKIFTNISSDDAPRDAVEGRLNIRPYGSSQGSIDPASPFTADGAVQAYNYRFCVTKDPANRVMITEPPPGYDREEFVNFGRKSIATNAGPNLKSHMNSPILPGENHAYPEADWPTREKIIERHRNFGLGLIWFLQNDEATPEAKRAGFREWGLPRDEFADHGHIPYEMYVREARRIVGRHVFTEHDNSFAPGLARTPIFADSIATTDWYMDSHSCTTESRPGFHYDGKLILTEESRPAQIPYRALLPQGVDNLLVPVCLSATHVAWGAIRLEPVWMQTSEAVGFAAALAKREKTTPAQLDPEVLLRTLVERRQLVSFFSDVKVDAPEPAIRAAQYFGTKGFFHDYNARLAEPLKLATGRLWIGALAKLRAGDLDANALARAIAEAELSEATTTEAEFSTLLSPGSKPNPDAGSAAITRGAALHLLWTALN